MSHMLKGNRLLMVAAAALFLLSFLSYRESVVRAERFERGQKFLSNLNPDEIAHIVVTKDGETLDLKRQDDRFLVTSEHGYPASNSTVNRLLEDILELSLEKEVGSGDKLEDELGLRTAAPGAVNVTLKNEAGGEMVDFVVGNAFDEGSGHYVQRLDGERGPVYLTSERIALQTSGGDFVDKEILDVAEDRITAIRGDGFAYERSEEGLTLVGLAEGKAESAKASQVKGVLSGLRFQSHFLANDPSLGGLTFDRELEIVLDDNSSYQLAVGEFDGKHYLALRGLHEIGQVSVALDADEDEVRETSEMLVRGDEIKDFNALHGSFVYEVSKATADKVRVGASELVE